MDPGSLEEKEVHEKKEIAVLVVMILGNIFIDPNGAARNLVYDYKNSFIQTSFALLSLIYGYITILQVKIS